MSSPAILDAGTGTELWKQVRTELAQDSGQLGVLGALGDGVNSLFPNFTTDGPTADRTKTPAPLIILVDAGTRGLDRTQREKRIHVEIHDDEDFGDQRWPGLRRRVLDVLVVAEWRPKSDDLFTYSSGLYFEGESGTLWDERLHTYCRRLTLCARGRDRTSNRGYGGLGG